MPAFDRITRIAQDLFDVPIALVTLIDADWQWFKSRCGIARHGTPRDQAFCHYTIQHDSVFVVPDARADRRFASNPLVTGEPRIRFYAGAPLTVAPAIRLGSLCIIGTQPRDFSPRDMRCLAALAAQVVGEIWLQGLERAGGAAFSSLPPTPGTPPLVEEPWITGAQLRAARGLLNWSVARIASAAGVSPATIKRIEATNGATTARASIVRSVRAACEEKGVSFVGGEGVDPGGARLRCA